MNAYQQPLPTNGCFAIYGISAGTKSRLIASGRNYLSLLKLSNTDVLKDRFGVSWQIVPVNLDEILFYGTEDEIESVTAAFLKIMKFIHFINTLYSKILFY